MTTLKNIVLTAGMVALWGASALSAQTKAVAGIPFAFTVQDTTLPAGEYTMSNSSPAHNLMLIRSVETRKAALVLTPGSGSAYRRSDDKSVVVFHKVGDRYFLAEVKTDAVCAKLSPSKLERELTAEGGGRPIAAVILPALTVR
jgi:hypothetical protein